MRLYSVSWRGTGDRPVGSCGVIITGTFVGLTRGSGREAADDDLAALLAGQCVASMAISSTQQVGRVIRFAVRHLGFDYDLRQILDLVRLAAPLPSFARRWRSTLFDPNYVVSRRCICSPWSISRPGLGAMLRLPAGCAQYHGSQGKSESRTSECRTIPVIRGDHLSGGRLAASLRSQP